MNKESDLPLNGKTIVVTRSLEQQAEARLLFQRKGARVLDLPSLIIGTPHNWYILDNDLSELNKFNWIIFSSVNGVNSVEQRLKIIGSSLPLIPKGVKIAAVGRKTADFLEKLKVKVDFVPPKYVADSLIKDFPVIDSSYIPVVNYSHNAERFNLFGLSNH